VRAHPDRRRGAVLFKYLTTDPQVLGILAWAAAAITLLGFTITIWQLVRTRRAADAARQAALGLVRRVRSRELLVHLGNAHNHLDAARHHIGLGSRQTASLRLELSRASAIEARQLSTGMAGDWEELQGLVYRLREAEGRLAVMAEPVQDDPEFVPLGFLLRDASDSLQRCAAQARYAYDVDE
jgi:hypothetical protein